MEIVRGSLRNRLLGSLSPHDFDLLLPLLKQSEYAFSKSLHLADKPAEKIVFLEDGMASLIMKGPLDRDVEVGLIGREGMTGISAVLGGANAELSAYMLVSGWGYEISTASLTAILDESKTLRTAIMQFAQSLFIQTANTLLVNTHGDAEARLARWLLMVHDRSNGNDLYLTHQLISSLLGVRRPWVTETINVLEGKGLIRTERGKITILKRNGLIRTAGGYYKPLIALMPSLARD